MNELIAWFEGYSEHISDVPTKEQWERIKSRFLGADVCAGGRLVDAASDHGIYVYKGTTAGLVGMKGHTS